MAVVLENLGLIGSLGFRLLVLENKKLGYKWHGFYYGMNVIPVIQPTVLKQ